MRKIISCLLISVLAAATLSVPAGAAEPKRGGTLREIAPLQSGTFDPLFFRSPRELTNVWPAYNALVEHDPINVDTIGPGLADSWTVSPDGTTFTFKLHPGVKFHDGQAFTSADVKYTYEAILNPPAGNMSRRKPALQAVESITTPDALTVVIKNKYPSASFLAGIASMPIVPKHAHSKGLFVDKILGTGPFKFVSHTRDVEIVYKRNEDYWRKGLPYLDGVHLMFMTSTTARLQAMRTGRGDHCTVVGEAEEKVYREQCSDTIRLTKYGRLNMIALHLNHTMKDKPWADKRVRRALSLAIDRQEFINTVYGGDGEIIGVIPSAGGWALPPEELKKYPGYSGNKATKITQAKKLLVEAGYPNGFTVDSAAQPGYVGDVALFAQAALKEIGVKLQLKSADAPTTAKMRVEGNFQILATGAPTSNDDPDVQLSPYITGDTLNYGRYSNSKVDELYKQQSKIMDTAKRKGVVYEIQRILMDDMPAIMLVNRVDVGADAIYVRNMVYTAAQHFHFSKAFERVWLDK